MKVQSKKEKSHRQKSSEYEKTSINNVLYRGNFSLALKSIQDYIKKYPKDIKALTMYGKLLRLSKETEKADEILSSLVPLFQGQKELGFILIELIYLKLDTYDYAKAYDYFRLFQSLTFDNDLINKSLPSFLTKTLLEKKLNIYKPIIEREYYNYFERQVIAYDEAELLGHTTIFNAHQNLSDLNGYIRFNSEIDINNLYEDIKKVISNSIKTPNYNLFDTYLFYYPNIGFAKDGAINHLKVLVYPNSDNFDIVEFAPYRIKYYQSFINDFFELQALEELKRSLR